MLPVASPDTHAANNTPSTHPPSSQTFKEQQSPPPSGGNGVMNSPDVVETTGQTPTSTQRIAQANVKTQLTYQAGVPKEGNLESLDGESIKDSTDSDTQPTAHVTLPLLRILWNRFHL